MQEKDVEEAEEHVRTRDKYQAKKSEGNIRAKEEGPGEHATEQLGEEISVAYEGCSR